MSNGHAFIGEGGWQMVRADQMSKLPVSAKDARYVVRGPIAFGALAVNVNLRAFLSAHPWAFGGSWGFGRRGGILGAEKTGANNIFHRGDHSGLIEPLRVAGVQQQQHRLDVLVPLPERKNCIRKDAGLKGLALFNQKRNGEWGAWGHGACRDGGMGARHKQ